MLTPTPQPIGATRAQLIEHTDRYLAALAQRSPAQAGLSPRIRFTENGQELEIGDGLWATCSGIGSYRHFVADPIAQQAAVICVIVENGELAIFGLRIRVADGAITEAETIVSRDPLLFNRDGPQRLEALGTPFPLWSRPIPPEGRVSRAELIATASAYLDALDGNDGSRTAPLAPDADRWDNGMRATNAPELDAPGGRPFYALGASEQLASGYFQFVTRVRERRFPLVDEEIGVVFAVTFLDHAGTVHEITTPDGARVPIGIKQPFSWHIMDMFKIEDGLVRQMEVLLNKCFYGMPSGW